VPGAVTRHARYLRRRLRSLSRKGPSQDDEVLLMDMSSDSRTLLVAFGGIMGGIGMPPFEFLSLTGGIPVKRLFVRDLRQAWYHRGLAPHGETLVQAAQALRELLAAQCVERLVVAGNSAGGYAALVFGTLLDADVVLSFAPQTVLDLDALDAIGDHRWDGRLGPLRDAGALDEGWIDLRDALARVPAANTRYRVFFDESLATDRRHAERLRGLEGVRLYRFGRGAHELVRELRDCGALERMLRQALQAPGEPASAPEHT
jgi:pimeloyl-ACP methyl ester carboxylesterase